MSKRKLLLADDSMTIQKVVNLTFADEGIEVFTVGNGSLAIEKLSEIEPDLVLADVHMPGLNGYEVCEQIRMNPQFRDVPVMLLVGSFEPFDEREAQRVGANDFLTKPFQSIRQLIQKVTALLDHPKDGADGINAAEAPAVAAQTEVSQENSLSNDREDFYVETPASSQSDLNSPSHDFSDAALDDEMIETSSAGNFDDGLSASMPSVQSGEQNSYNENEMMLEADEQSTGEMATGNETVLTESTPLEMRSTEPLSFADVQDFNSSMLAPLQSEQPDDLQTLAAEETDVASELAPATDFVQNLPTNNWEQSASSEKFEEQDEQFEVELDLPSSEEQVFQNPDFEIISDEEPHPLESAAEIENIDFLSANRVSAVQDALDDEPLELDLAEANLLQIDDEDSILDLDNEETVDEMPSAEFDVLPAMQEAVVRQNFNQPSGNALAQAGNRAIANMNLGFPPEVIEAIAQLVVEKLSDKVIERIAWEIVPDRFDLIVRQQMDQHNR